MRFALLFTYNTGCWYSIPVVTRKQLYCRPELNENVGHYYNILRIEFKRWVSNNSPRHGSIYHAMRSSRAGFKHPVIDS